MSDQLLQIDAATLVRDRTTDTSTHHRPAGFSDRFAYGFTKFVCAQVPYPPHAPILNQRG